MRLRCLIPILALLASPVQAEDVRCSIADLPASSFWRQTYHAHGREIAVDEVIQVPDVTKAPVLRVTAMQPLPDGASAKADKLIEKPGFRVFISRDVPSIYGDNTYQQGRMTQARAGLFDYDLHTAYTDSNPLTVAVAFNTTQAAFRQLYPDETLHLRNVATHDRVYDQVEQAYLGQKGYYLLECAQTFHGIPFMASVYDTFEQTGLNGEWDWARGMGLVHAHVWDENTYDVNMRLFHVQEVVQEDISLLPFDAVKGQMEELILSGHVRWVDSVSLGYVQYATDTEREFLLVPSWVIWCEYVKDGPVAQRDEPLYSDGAFYYSTYYKPIIINAQTGQRVDPASTEPGRDRYAEIYPY